MDAPTLTPDKPTMSPLDSPAVSGEAPSATPSSVLPPPSTPPPSVPGAAAPAANAPQVVRTPALIASMVAAAKDASDLIFSPGRAPQVDMHGGLIQLKIPGVGVLTPEDTARIAADLIGRNSIALQKLKEQGSCDISYSLPKVSRFRVNVFTQRGTCAIVMRVIPSAIPDFKSLSLPEQLSETINLRNGIVLVTGPTGSGKSSTLAAILNKINEEKAYHIITIEDPIEFLHPHKRATIHQRELHSDTPSFALALRAALRQAPKVILVGEMRDKETIEVALEAAETGHVVFSTLHTTDASKTIERIIGVFPLADQNAIRNRLAKAFRYIISQRLIPRLDGKGRVAAFEMLKSTMRTREYVEKGETEGKSLLDAMRDGETEGMQYFDGEIEKLMRANIVDIETGLSYSTNAGNLRLQIADLIERHGENNFPSAVIKPVPLRDTEIER
jgi:twitching motility protein PilT